VFAIILRVLPLVLILLLKGEARAEESSTEQQYERGYQLRAQGKDSEALAVFQAIDSEHPSGRSKAQIALAKQALGLWVEAEVDLVAALAHHEPWVEDKRGVLELALSKIAEHLGSLEIVLTNEQSAEVFVDGSPYGTLPQRKPLRLSLGTHLLRIVSATTQPIERSTVVQRGTLTRESITLVPAPIAGRGGSPASTPTGETKTADRPMIQTQTLEKPNTGASTLGFVLAGTGLGAGALAIGGVVVSNQAAEDYNRDSRCGLTVKPQVCTEARSTTNDWRNVAIVSGIAGAALLATGLVLILLPSPKPKVMLYPFGGQFTF
jgi:hypothetical protein